MTLLISIFGGMLLTSLIYGGARAGRLSNFWSAVIAAGVPSLAYMVYAVFDWQGLDVVTMHVIAYPTVAFLLYHLAGARGATATRVHWAPKLMIAFFVFLTALFAGFVHIAGQGLPPALARMLLPETTGGDIHTGFAGVVAHGGDAAKVIGHHRRMESRLARLGWRVEVEGLDGLRPDSAMPVRVRILDRDGGAVADARVGLGLGHPGQPPVRVLELTAGADGAHRVDATLPGSGVWLATLTLEGAGETVVMERRLGGE